jgi:DNA primase
LKTGTSAANHAPRGSFTPGAAGRFEPRGRQPASAGSQTINRGPYHAASPQLALSPIMRGQRSALSRREALILQSLLNHPWLLHDHLEQVAALELAHPEAHKLRAGIIAAYAHYSHTDEAAAETARLRAVLDKSGYSKQIQLVERALTTRDVWGAQPGAAAEDVISTWHQLVALHHKAHALLRERKDAELALSQEPTEANFAWLKDVSSRLESMDGTEALIEGFGEQSGRFQRSM